MKISSLKELEKISHKIIKKLSKGDFIFLYGEIGTGKTTFTRFIINNLELKNNTKLSEILSPTFNIVFEYYVKQFTIKHFDLYRIKKKGEIENLGLFESKEKSITIIEWPELIENKPKDRIDILFKYTENINERILTIAGTGRFKNYDFEK